nr:MAG TPA: hypothetical protein [Caudoviricetes sp.]DAM19756.1 MAG TPA: hypothetical protein [Caudoviricetes sp.]
MIIPVKHSEILKSWVTPKCVGRVNVFLLGITVQEI